MSYAWTISVDYSVLDEPLETRPPVCTNDNAVGLVGPSKCRRSHLEILQHPKGKTFRMYDGDDELIYQGVLVGGTGFEPLEDFGEPNMGATKICYQEANGSWKEL